MLVFINHWFLIYFIENSCARHFCIWKYPMNVVEEMFSNGAAARNVESGKAGCDHCHYHIYDILRFHSSWLDVTGRCEVWGHTAWLDIMTHKTILYVLCEWNDSCLLDIFILYSVVTYSGKVCNFVAPCLKKMLLKLESKSVLYIMTILSLKIHYCLPHFGCLIIIIKRNVQLKPIRG